MIARAQDLALLADDEAIVDLFAGFGGASTGIEDALGLSPDVALNHDELALRNHEANHPRTQHLCENILRVRPFIPKGYRRIGLVWASPDCTHHSNAKGGKPRETGRRLLAWVVVEWARETHPRVICLENVPEFRNWGPLDDKGKPIPERKGETFREFVSALQLAGYRVEHRVLTCSDYGSRTRRRRLFLIARCDGRPIVWPDQSHGAGRAPERVAAECVDWSIPCRSIFERKRPLAPATEKRIAEGIRRYVLGKARPFLIGIDHQGSGTSPVWSVDEPLTTATCENRHALVAPTLVQTGYGERIGQAPRVLDLQAPLGTVVAGGQKHGLVAAFLTKDYGGPNGNPNRGAALDEPLHTVTALDHHRLIRVHLEQHGRPHGPAVAAFLTKHYGSGGQWSGLDEPMHTIPTLHRMGLVTVTIDGEEYVDIGFRMLEPRELARAHGFDDHVMIGTKRDQVRLIGNSVPREPVAAIVRANLGSPVPVLAAA